MSSRVVAFIFARGGSKGIPRKNIKPLAGKPLIGYAIDIGLSSDLIDRVIVSTDDEEIAQVARKLGAEVPFLRPGHLAQDDSPEWLAWQHALQTLQHQEDTRPEVFVSIPPTSPLRQVEDVEKCIRLLARGDTDVVITVTEAHRNPYFNMVRMDGDGLAHLLVDGGSSVVRRQDAPLVYDMTTVAYAARPEFVLEARSVFDGRVRALFVPPERALDIDMELDFQFAEFLLRHSEVEGGGLRGGA